MSNPLYVFDMDDTLINGDCAMIWNAFLVEKGIATQADFLDEDRRLMALYAAGEMDMEDYLQFSMAPLANMPIEHIQALAAECVDSHIMPRLYPQAKQLIEQLNHDNITMVIISASVTFLVEAVAKRLGIATALGIDLIQTDGCYSSHILGVPSYREGKVTRLEAWKMAQTDTYSDIHFYSDSINDLPLCQHADFTYLVNPCPRLSAYQDQPNWTVLQWGSSNVG